METNSDIPDKVPQLAPNGAYISTAALFCTSQLAGEKAPSVFWLLCLTVPLLGGAIQRVLCHSLDQRVQEGQHLGRVSDHYVADSTILCRPSPPWAVGIHTLHRLANQSLYTQEIA